MSQRDHEGATYMELTPDAWHQNDAGNYYIDCPECGSAASLMNIVKHGRCNGYMDQRESETELDEEKFDCTAKLHLELGYRSAPDETMSEDAPGESASDAETEEGVPSSEEPAGSDGVVSSDQQ